MNLVRIEREPLNAALERHRMDTDNTRLKASMAAGEGRFRDVGRGNG